MSGNQNSGQGCRSDIGTTLGSTVQTDGWLDGVKINLYISVGGAEMHEGQVVDSSCKDKVALHHSSYFTSNVYHECL